MLIRHAMLIDVHVHSHHSPGCTLAPRDIVRRAKEAGLDGVVVTDLNTLEGSAEVRAAGRELGLVALCGAEFVTDHGHYLCYFPEPDRVPAPPQMFGTTPWPVHEVVRRVREMGGAVVAAHPYDKSVERPSGDFIFTLDGLAALQGLCARKRGPANDLAIEAADHMTLPCVGGSGAHETLDDIGKAATLFRAPVASEADLVRQLLAGHVFCVSIGGAPAAARGERGGRERERHGGRRGGDDHG
ncbi:MAG TPA: PHP domain-containing protein, partial [Anaeromyxobacteraceae bacterium]